MLLYTQTEGWDDIKYKYSSTTNITFPTEKGENVFANPSGSGGTTPYDYGDVTSTKQNFSGEVVLLATSTDNGFESNNIWYGRLKYTNPLPVELSSFISSVSENGVELLWRTETEVNNYGFEIHRQTRHFDFAQCDRLGKDWICSGKWQQQFT